MKDVYEVLRLKELELSRVEMEVEALRIVAPLLSDDGECGSDNKPILTLRLPSLQAVQVPEAANTNPQPEHAPEWKERTVGRP